MRSKNPNLYQALDFSQIINLNKLLVGGSLIILLSQIYLLDHRSINKLTLCKGKNLLTLKRNLKSYKVDTKPFN